VKKFLKEDAEFYNIPVEYSGGDPVLLLFDDKDILVKKYNLVGYDRFNIIMLLEKDLKFPRYTEEELVDIRRGIKPKRKSDL
jgi:hypothetical protein